MNSLNLSSYQFHCQSDTDSFDIQVKNKNGPYCVEVLNESNENPSKAVKIKNEIHKSLSEKSFSAESIGLTLKDLKITPIEKLAMEPSSAVLKVDGLRAASLIDTLANTGHSLEATEKKTIPSTIVEGALGRQIDRLLTELMEKEHLNGSIRIMKNGEVVLQKGYGKASSTKNKPETIFRLASISKSLTAAAIMRLQDKGNLNVLDPISKHLPFIREKIKDLKEELIDLKQQQKLEVQDNDELANKIAENTEQILRLKSINIEHLITHRSGLPQLEDAEPEAITSFQLSEHQPHEYIDRLKDKPITRTPGNKYDYNNYGYFLLAQIMQNVCNKSYAEVIKEEIFIPLEMNASSCPIRTEDDTPGAQPYTLKQYKFENLEGYIKWIDGTIEQDNPDVERLHALKEKRIECKEQLHELKGINEPLVPVEIDHCSVRIGSGNINSNVIDLAKFEAALSGDFLSKDSQLTSATKGYGWDLYGAKAEKSILGKKADGQGKRGWTMKDGQGVGTHTVIWRFPDQQSSLIMLCNSDMKNDSRGDLGGLSIEISKLLLA